MQGVDRVLTGSSEEGGCQLRGHKWSEGVNEALGVGLGEGLKRPLRWEGRPLGR